MQEYAPYHSHEEVPKRSGNFGFMRKIIEVCYRLTPSDVSIYDAKWSVHFKRGEDGNPELVPSSRVASQGGEMTILPTDSVLRRTGMFPKNFPIVSRKTPVEEVVMGVDSFFDDKISDRWFLQSITVRSTTTTVWSILAGMKLSFKEHETVQKVERLEIGDQMFISLEKNSQIYSITVRASSRESNWMKAALCSVTYRVNSPRGKGNVSRQNIEWLMYLPIMVGSKMMFTEKGKEVHDLTTYSIQKIQLRCAKSQIRN